MRTRLSEKVFFSIVFFAFFISFLGTDLVQAVGLGLPCDGGVSCDAGLECKCGKCKTICTGICIENPLCTESFEELIENLIDFIFWVGIAIAPLMIIVAAFYFLTSGGNPQKVKTAKDIIFWTVIGLTIVLLAKGIIAMVRGIIGG